jgi:hypothetical protein
MRANPLFGPLEGVGPKNHDFLSPNGCCHFRAQKSLNFQGPTLPVSPEIDFYTSKSLRPAPYKQQGTLIVNFSQGKIFISFTKQIHMVF